MHVWIYEQLAWVLAKLQVGPAIILHSYGAEPVLPSMRASGMLLRREPVTDETCAAVQLVRALVVVDSGQAMPAGAMIPPRRFTDAQLARVAAGPNRVMCECPRHIAELIGQLGSFEEYRRLALIGPPARCTRSTSAPMSASIMAVNGPGPSPANSTTFTPARGSPMSALELPHATERAGHRHRAATEFCQGLHTFTYTDWIMGTSLGCTREHYNAPGRKGSSRPL